MTILTPGHRYIAHNLDDKANGQTIQFIEKVPFQEDPTKLVTVNDGTTNEELLKILIDRIAFLQAKHACRENAIVLTKLEESLMWLNKRTADRVTRGVEGTNQK